MNSISVFEYDSYKPFIKAVLKSLPSKGRGSVKKIADHMRMHPTHVSQVLSRDKNFNLEQGLGLAKYFGLSAGERDYFLLLIQKDRAGSPDLTQYFDQKLQILRDQSKTVGGQVYSERVIDERYRSQYYSDWIYSAIRVAVSIPALQSRLALANALGVSEETVAQAVVFLIQAGICQRSGDKITATQAHIHVAGDTPLGRNHHRNWRLRSTELLGVPEKQDLRFTAPFSSSKKDREKVRAILLKAIKDMSALVKDSPNEQMSLMAIDLISLSKE